LVQIIAILGARRREMKGSVGERLRLLDARASACAARHTVLVTRLAALEGGLEHLERARRTGPRRERIVHLRQQVEMLRGSKPHLAAARVHQLGSALLYVGGLLVLWVVLLELGLAVGLT
jgi:hypothetical protein